MAFLFGNIYLWKFDLLQIESQGVKKMPLVLAHRGANKVAPQNTIPAFEKALQFNSDGIETDVHLCADGEIVICHNYTVDATSNGSGAIDEMTFSELRRLDFGSYFSNDFKGVTLPTLSELLELVKNMTLINIEIKSPQKDNDLVKRVVEEIYKFGVEKNTIISCFDPECIRKVKEIDSSLKTGLLYERGALGEEIMNFGVAKYCKQLKADAAHPEHILMTEELIKDLHNNDIKVNPWTINSREDIIKYTSWGCDALISDVPDFCRQVLKEIE